MTSDQVFNPVLWFFLLGWMAISMPLYIFILWKSWKWAIIYLGVVFLLAVYAAFFSVHNFGGAFGAGSALSCLTAILVPISLIIWILVRRPFGRKFGDDVNRRRLYVFGGLLIVVTHLFPFFGSMTIDSACFRITQRNAEPLIAAVETYYRENGTYPKDVVSLQPEYLAEIPTPGCSWLSTQPDWPPVSYKLQVCRDGPVLLTNESSDGTSIERYNYDTGVWSSVSFLDGACSYLR
jgi:hypothetical protein